MTDREERLLRFYAKAKVALFNNSILQQLLSQVVAAEKKAASKK